MVALGSVLAYLYYSKSEESSPSLDGININLDPDKILDSAMAYKRVDERYREPIKNAANKILYGFMKKS